jgi:hypothetical protein
MQPFASGRNSHAFCDRCGFRYPYSDLKTEIVKLKPTGLRVCSACHDPDHPQLQLGMYPVEDPQALREPRTDLTRGISRTIVVQLGAPEFWTLGAIIGAPVGAGVGSVTVFIH